MSCEHCEHHSIAYRHYRRYDESEGGYVDVYELVAKPFMYDEGSVDRAEPVLSWPAPDINFIDWADGYPRLVVGAFDADGEEAEVSIPVRYCPNCGDALTPWSDVTHEMEVDA